MIDIGPALAIGMGIGILFLLFGFACGSQPDVGYGSMGDVGAGTMDGYGYDSGGSAGSEGESTWNTDPGISGDPNY